jgi:hypothetical protein
MALSESMFYKYKIILNPYYEHIICEVEKQLLVKNKYYKTKTDVKHKLLGLETWDLLLLIKNVTIIFPNNTI